MTSSSKDYVVVLSRIPWHFLYQRPQHLVSRVVPPNLDVLYFHTATFTETWQARRGARGPGLNPVPDNVHLRPSPIILPKRVGSTLQLSAHLLKRRALGKRCALLWAYDARLYRSWYRKILPDTPVLYDICDDHTQFPNAADWWEQMEHDLMADADFFSASATSLVETMGRPGARPALVRNGVDLQRLDAGLGTAPPGPLPGKPPYVVYVGALYEWLDAELLDMAARMMPDVTFLLIGPAREEPKAKLKAPNLHLLGSMPFEHAASYMAVSRVGIIPFQITPLIMSTNPIKMYEYLGAGLSVVSTPFPEVQALEEPGIVECAGNPGAFAAAIRRNLDAPQEGVLARRRQIAAENSWDQRADVLRQHIARYAPEFGRTNGAAGPAVPAR